MPRVWRHEEQTMISENTEQLMPADAPLHRRMVVNLADVAQDRIDIAEAVKCFTRHMNEPRSGHMVEVRTSRRHLIKNKQGVYCRARYRHCTIRCKCTRIRIAETCSEGGVRQVH